MKLFIILFALAFGTVLAASTRTRKPRVLMIVTSASQFANGEPTGLWLEEFAVPYLTLLQGGVEVTVVSPKGGATPIDPRSTPTPEQEAQWAEAAKVLQHTTPLTDGIHAKEFDAVFIPGGHGPLFDLANSAEVAKVLSDFASEGKPVAAVCHGPAALVGAKLANGDPLVKGKKLTAFSDSEEKAAKLDHMVPFSVQQKLIALGGSYSQGPNFQPYAVQDGQLITGQNPPSSQKTAELLLHALQSGEATAK